MSGDTAHRRARDGFLRGVARGLGRPAGPPGEPAAPPGLPDNRGPVGETAASIRALMMAEAAGLMSRLEASAAQAGWRVARAASGEEAAGHIVSLARDLEVRSAVRSAHTVLEGLDLDRALSSAGVAVEVMGVETGATEAERRKTMIDAGMGIVGADYAIAETGTCVLLARKGVSRLVSLLPPVLVAVVERGQVLPGLDELFALCAERHAAGDPTSQVSLISGPSRSADIEHTIVTGVHGPGEVHMVLLG